MTDELVMESGEKGVTGPIDLLSLSSSSSAFAMFGAFTKNNLLINPPGDPTVGVKDDLSSAPSRALRCRDGDGKPDNANPPPKSLPTEVPSKPAPPSPLAIRLSLLLNLLVTELALDRRPSRAAEAATAESPDGLREWLPPLPTELLYRA